MEGNAVPILRELSAKLNIPEHEFFTALADLLPESVPPPRPSSTLRVKPDTQLLQG